MAQVNLPPGFVLVEEPTLPPGFEIVPADAPSRQPARDVSADIASQQGGYSGSELLDVAKGFGKGVLGTVFSGGDLIRRGLGMERVIDTPEVQALTQPTNPAQRGGNLAEQVVELGVGGAPIVRGAMKAPGIIARGMGISKARAATNLTNASTAAKDVAVNAEGPGQSALRILELKDRGASAPNVVTAFMRRVTDPTKGPVTFTEARDYYSNISRLSANEFGKLNPTMQREVGAMKEALHKALTEAAGTVGKADEYATGLAEYARAMRARHMAKSGAKWAGGAAGVYGITKLID